MITTIRHLCIAALLTIHVSVPANEASPVDSLSAQLQNMTSLTANFSQTIKDESGNVLQTAKGELTVKRPRQFYWRTTYPYEHLVVTDGTILWLYDIDLEQITRQAFNADLDKAPALLLSGEVEEISQQYTVTVNDGGGVYELIPNDPEALFRALTLEFKNDLLHTMSFLDGFGQNTMIEFNNVILNPAVENDVFKFVPPNGIDVIFDD